MSERERLCEDFWELQAGTLVRVECGCDGGTSHRGILMGFDPSVWGVLPNGDFATQPGWKLYPSDEDHERTWLSPSAVAARCVFIIETGLEQETPVSTEARKPARVGR